MPIKDFLYNLLIIPLIIFGQVFIFNNIFFFHRYNPIIYIAWIIFYPFEKSYKNSFLILSFLLGLGMDILMDTGGINAFASLFIAYIRNSIIRYIMDIKYEAKVFSFKEMNGLQLSLYIYSMVIIHHLILFILESFKISIFFFLIKDIIITSVFSFLFIIIIYAFVKNKIKE